MSHLDDPHYNLSSFQLGLRKDLELVSALHENAYEPPFVANFALYMQHICVVFACISFAFVMFVVALRDLTTEKKITQQRKFQIAYQATNLCVNLTLGLYGIYHYNATLPHIKNLTVAERIVGFEDYLIFSCIQIGYNLWSLPVGYFLINETAAMMFHHIATICVSVVSGISTTGLRYYAVFFLGVIEISSVPLALMNFCKSNKELANEYFPRTKELIRPIFAAMFLTTRVLMWTPNILSVVRTVGMLLWTSTSFQTSFALVMLVISAAYLTMLQYYWGYLITKGLIDMFFKSMDKKLKTA